MPALQVRDCPEDLYEELKFYALRDDRSLAQQTLHVLKCYVAEQRKAPCVQSGDAVSFGGYSGANPQSSAGFSVKPQDEIERRQEKRHRIFAGFDADSSKRPGGVVPLPEGYDSSADMVRDMRENRIQHLCGERMVEGPIKQSGAE